MNFKYYSKILFLNDITMHKFRNHSLSKKIDWAVTEFIDGDHIAIHADAAKNEFKIATRNKFLIDYSHYSCAKEIASLYKDWAISFSKKEKCPIIVYGKAVGGHYNGIGKGTKINTVCEYMVFNELIIHDIELVGKGGRVSQLELDNYANQYQLKIAPVLYVGDFSKVCGHPENKLSAVPFTVDLEPLYGNEMKGIVIRPVYDLFMGTDRLIMKKLNRNYIGKKQEALKPSITPDLLIEIANHIDNEAARLSVINDVLKDVGELKYDRIKELSGKYVLCTLDKVSYVKYNVLDKQGKHLVNKELNKLAHLKLSAIIRMCDVA